MEKNIEEVQELLEQMELEIRESPPYERQKYQSRLKSYKDELVILEKELRRAKIAYRDDASARDELLGDDLPGTEDQRQRLLDNTDRLERMGTKLEAGYKIVVETEQIGSDILDNLSSQRETIQKSRNRLREADDDLSKSSRILNSMMRRIMQNRFILMIVAVVMVCVVVVTIYLTASR